jgi:hypothetical protein
MSDGSRTIKRIRGEVILGVVIGNVARDHSMIARLRVRLKVGFDPHNQQSHLGKQVIVTPTTLVSDSSHIASFLWDLWCTS